MFSRHDVRPSECSLVHSVHQLFASLTDLLGTDSIGARHQTTRCSETWYSAFGRAVWLYICTTCCLANRRWALNINPTSLFLSYKLNWNSSVPPVDLKPREACDMRVEVPLHPYLWEQCFPPLLRQPSVCLSLV